MQAVSQFSSTPAKALLAEFHLDIAKQVLPWNIYKIQDFYADSPHFFLRVLEVSQSLWEMDCNRGNQYSIRLKLSNDPFSSDAIKLFKGLEDIDRIIALALSWCHGDIIDSNAEAFDKADKRLFWLALNGNSTLDNFNLQSPRVFMDGWRSLVHLLQLQKQPELTPHEYANLLLQTAFFLQRNIDVCNIADEFQSGISVSEIIQNLSILDTEEEQGNVISKGEQVHFKWSLSPSPVSFDIFVTKPMYREYINAELAGSGFNAEDFPLGCTLSSRSLHKHLRGRCKFMPMSTDDTNTWTTLRFAQCAQQYFGVRPDLLSYDPYDSMRTVSSMDDAEDFISEVSDIILDYLKGYFLTQKRRDALFPGIEQKVELMADDYRRALNCHIDRLGARTADFMELNKIWSCQSKERREIFISASKVLYYIMLESTSQSLAYHPDILYDLSRYPITNWEEIFL